jgi:hypothetical protein
MKSRRKKMEVVEKWAPKMVLSVKAGLFNLDGVYSLALRRKELARAGELDPRYCAQKGILPSTLAEVLI